VVLPCYTPPCDVPQGNRSADPDGDDINYTWFFIDNPAMIGNQPTLSIPVAETVKVGLTVYDHVEACHRDEVTISVAPTNQPPVADAQLLIGPVKTGWPVQFAGFTSSDPDGDLIRSPINGHSPLNLMGVK
jgi:hypothetical protein